MRDLFGMEGKMGQPFDNIVKLMGAENTPWGTFQQRHMLSMSGAVHKRVRDVLAPSFTPRQANAHRPLMRRTIADLLDEWAPRGAFDFESFGNHLVLLPGDVVQLYLRDPAGNLVEVDQAGAERLPDDLRARLKGLWDFNAQGDEQMRGRLFVPSRAAVRAEG